MKFHFANPGFLWLCLSVPPLLWWWLRQRRRALRHPVAGLLGGIPSGRAQIARWGGVGLRALALLLLAVALAGPRWPDLRTRIETEGIAIMMVVDVSGSMGPDMTGKGDFKWDGEEITRFEAAKRAFTLFINGSPGDGGANFAGRPTDLVGLVTFASRPEAVCPPTLSHSVVLNLLEKQDPQLVESGEKDTNISDALVVALVRLKNTPARRKVIVLLSDGENNPTLTRAGWNTEKVARIANELKMPIYYIDAEPQPDLLTPERSRLIEAAKATGGHYFPAADRKGLLTACESIDRFEKSDITSYRYRRYHEAYPWLGGTAFLLLVLVSVLDMTVWRRIP